MGRTLSAEDGLFGGGWKPALHAKSLGRRALDLVFPPRALDGATAAAGGLSVEAWSRIRFIDGPVCDGCGAPFEFDLGQGVRCAACMAKPRAFAAARAACLYDEASREPILKLKHADRPDLAPMFALWIGRAARELIAEADAVAPVPLHPLRLIKRKYNQAAEIARPLARREGLVYLPDALVPPAQDGEPGGQVRIRAAAQCGGRLRGSGEPATSGGGQAHPADRRRDDHGGHGRGLRAGAEVGRRGARGCRSRRTGSGDGRTHHMKLQRQFFR